MIGRKKLFSGVAPLALHSALFAGGLLLANIAAVAPARADACTAGSVIDAANGTTCSGGSTDGDLTYVDSNGNYQGGNFTLTLDNHDVTNGGVILTDVDDGDGFITLENGSDVDNKLGNGIFADVDELGDDDNDITVKVVGAISVTGAISGISASAQDGTVTVETGEGSTARSTGGAGIFAGSRGSGDVTVTTGNGSLVRGEGDRGGDINFAHTGIDARSDSGNITIETGQDSRAESGDPTNSAAIVADTDTGTIQITTGAASQTTGADGGINAHTLTGNITIGTGDGSTVSGAADKGIVADSVTGAITVTMGANSTVSGVAGAGIDMLSLSGPIEVTAGAGASVTGDDGILALASTTIKATVGQNARIRGRSGDGLDVSSGGAVTVTMEAGSLVDGDNGEGINARTQTGALTVTMEANTVAEGDGSGIAALSTTGAVKITTGAGSKATGANGSGINASSGGTVTVETGANSTAIGSQLNGDGILAASTAGGDVFVDAGANSSITGGDDGIDAQGGTGNVSVIAREGTKVTGGSCQPNTGCLGSGIEATTLGAGTITIDNRGVTRGTDTAVTATSATGAIQITNIGTIEDLTLNAANVVIRTAGGAATINNNNNGLIRGRIETGIGNDVLNNNGRWVTRGFSVFGDGIDSITNNGVIEAGNAGDVAGADVTNLLGLETFNNNGAIILADQLARDGTNFSDRFSTNDGNYVGNAGAVLAVDASLGGADSNSDILIVGGDTSGVTRIVVNNTSRGGGALNTEGILVVNVGGTAEADDFVLANGPIDAGFFVYDLVFNNTDQANDQFLLVSEADGELFEPLAAVAASQEIWRETADAWAARQQAVRDRLSFGPIVTAVADPPQWGSIAPENGLWFSALGSWTARDSEISGFDLSYDQSIYGFVAGADFGIDLGNDGTVMFGVLAGYVDSSLNFDASPTSIKTDGATLGVYASLVDGGFFANVLIQADLLNQTFSAPSLGADSSADADVVSIGARADLGYRFDMDGLFIEPVLSLDAMSTSIDEFSVGGADIDAGSNESFRGGAGLRLGLAGERATASLTGRVWNVFATDNEIVFTAEDTLLDLADDGLEGLYGEVSGQVDIDLSETTVLFAKGGVLFSDDITKPSVSGGFTFAW